MALYENNNKVSEDFEYCITKADWRNQPKIINDYKIHADKMILLQLGEAIYRLIYCEFLMIRNFHCFKDF